MAAKIYAEQLWTIGEGHALWEPHPGRQEPVTIGDVGYIRAGFLHRLFNILLPPPNPPDHRKVPQDFVQLKLPNHDINCRDDIARSGDVELLTPLGPGVFHSESVAASASGIEVSGGTDVARLNAGLSFQCTESQGAALVLMKPAYRTDVTALGEIEEYIRRHYKTWLSFANDVHGRGIQISDLLVVTGCDMTSKWAMAAFKRSAVHRYMSIGASAPGGFSAQFSHNHGWSSGRRSNEELQSTGPEPFDQCVFFRSFRLKERLLGTLAPKIIKAAARPRDLGGPSRDDGFTGGPVLSSESEVEILSDVTEDANILNPILEYILMASNVNLAIAHDYDIRPFIGKATSLVQIRSELKSHRPAVVVKDGVGSFGESQRSSNDRSKIQGPPKAPYRSSSFGGSSHEVSGYIPTQPAMFSGEARPQRSRASETITSPALNFERPGVAAEGDVDMNSEIDPRVSRVLPPRFIYSAPYELHNGPQAAQFQEPVYPHPLLFSPPSDATSSDNSSSQGRRQQDARFHCDRCPETFTRKVNLEEFILEKSHTVALPVISVSVIEATCLGTQEPGINRQKVVLIGLTLMHLIELRVL
ncbi:hypothetical protein JAAARDRAFT_196750 [Jaapia argillacea MUCL 33604]|uniref:Uncharacterized protein n=1 Tax=Jaapia argillacea MUCL 33604 TaxID=933084 RepID=A0A067PHM8_9AGAM|nr:hypothetical protein JAAARDRAFT_196750 [Jaapia argillacea MUCL 33604]